MSKGLEVGIDIEYHSDRIQKIARRFLRPDETYTTTSDLLIAWCAKEAAYKLFSEEHLTYQEMKVDISENQLINLKTTITINFVPSIHSEYVIVMCWANK